MKARELPPRPRRRKRGCPWPHALMAASHVHSAARWSGGLSASIASCTACSGCRRPSRCAAVVRASSCAVVSRWPRAVTAVCRGGCLWTPAFCAAAAAAATVLSPSASSAVAGLGALQRAGSLESVAVSFQPRVRCCRCCLSVIVAAACRSPSLLLLLPVGRRRCRSALSCVVVSLPHCSAAWCCVAATVLCRMVLCRCVKT